MKACFKCGSFKPLSEFYRHQAMADGHLNKCKSCTKADVHSYRHGKGREKVLAYDRERSSTDERKSHRALTTSRWRQDHPDRRSAQVILGNAVRAKKVVPWPACEMPECSMKPEAHHPHYASPLLVVWLCSAHHKQAHALTRKLSHI